MIGAQHGVRLHEHQVVARCHERPLHNVLRWLSGVGAVHATQFLPASVETWLLRTSGSLVLGKYFKRTSLLFSDLCTPQATALRRLSHGNLWNLPYAQESTRLCGIYLFHCTVGKEEGLWMINQIKYSLCSHLFVNLPSQQEASQWKYTLNDDYEGSFHIITVPYKCSILATSPPHQQGTESLLAGGFTVGSVR